VNNISTKLFQGRQCASKTHGLGVIARTLVQFAHRLYNWLCISYSEGEYAYTLIHRAYRARPPPKTNKTQWPDLH